MPTNIRLPEKKSTDTNGIKNSDKIINNITVFGDSAIPENDEIYKSVFEMSKYLAENGYAIVNGGGPGLMKAATDGAESVGGHTVAVYWEPKLASFFEGKNLANIADETDSQSNYVNRTFGLIERGDVYVVCKGGTGTVSEFGLVWCLAKLYYGAHKPIILYGNFWPELIEAFTKTMYIDPKELAVLYYANTPEEVLNIIEKHEMMLDLSKIKAVNGDEKAFLLQPKAKKTIESYESLASSYSSDTAAKLVAKDQLEDFASLVNPPAHVLDIGCGPGYDTQFLSERYAVKAIDPVEKFVAMAQFDNPNAEVLHADISEYQPEKNTYKGIWARDSLHHITDEKLEKAFEHISKALVEGGIFYTIVREGEGEIVENEQKNYGTLERYYNLFSTEKLINLAKKYNMELVKLDRNKRSHQWIVGVFRKI